MTPFRTERLNNDVEVEFTDCSNRYFGDYHRVCVEIRISINLSAGSATRLQQVRRLERMGVAGADVETIRNQLVDDYWRHAGHYLAHPDYPARLLAAQTAKSADRSQGRTRR